MTQAELNERIEKHDKWLRGEIGGERLDIGAQYDVRGLDFDGRDLRSAIFQGADLSFTSFCAANLRNAYLDNAIFNHTDFYRATISYNEDLILKLAKDTEESRQKKSPSDTSAQAPSAKAD